MRQLEILEEVLNEFKKDKSIYGVMLMGSVADGTASETSDLDLFLLCDRDRFEAEFTGNTLIEFIYMKYETALYKLQNSDMEVYHYINSKIIYDNGQLQQLAAIANNKFGHYRTNIDTRKGIYHWLVSVKVKLQSALNADNSLLMNFLTATNSWKVIEAVWAVNDRPMPPSASVSKFINEIKIFPEERWFEKLFTGSDMERTKHLLKTIDWVLPVLKIGV